MTQTMIASIVFAAVMSPSVASAATTRFDCETKWKDEVSAMRVTLDDSAQTVTISDGAPEDFKTQAVITRSSIAWRVDFTVGGMSQNWSINRSDLSIVGQVMRAGAPAGPPSVGSCKVGAS